MDEEIDLNASFGIMEGNQVYNLGSLKEGGMREWEEQRHKEGGRMSV